MNPKELVLKFMEVEPIKKSENSYHWSDFPWFSCSYPTREETLQAIVNYMPYEKDWNKLIPVIKKCREIHKRKIFHGNNALMQRIEKELFDKNATANDLYKTACRFILAYYEHEEKTQGIIDKM
jgi:hypothetical protein